MILENYRHIEGIKNDIAEKCGRRGEDIRILPVSKKKTAEDIMELYNAGIKSFGENYVQELLEKKAVLPDDIEWEMIGHLQSNKVRMIAPFIHRIHSVDSLSLADKIDKEAAKCGRRIPVLIEVNAGGEETKFGVGPSDAVSFAMEIVKRPNIRLDGFMTSAPPVDDPSENRDVFAKMKQIMIDTNSKLTDNYKVSVLSMGMSEDFEEAIRQGSTVIRVGTKIFGKRIYQ